MQPHYTNNKGLDLRASFGPYTIIGEAINWYGGYIHPLRFQSIVESLSVKADFKFFICAGVKPTAEQCRVLQAMSIKLIHLPKQLLDVITKNTIRVKSILMEAICKQLFEISSDFRDLVVRSIMKTSSGIHDLVLDSIQYLNKFIGNIQIIANQCINKNINKDESILVSYRSEVCKYGQKSH